jgi:hypothetical protein
MVCSCWSAMAGGVGHVPFAVVAARPATIMPGEPTFTNPRFLGVRESESSGCSSTAARSFAAFARIVDNNAWRAESSAACIWPNAIAVAHAKISGADIFSPTMIACSWSSREV